MTRTKIFFLVGIGLALALGSCGPANTNLSIATSGSLKVPCTIVTNVTAIKQLTGCDSVWIPTEKDIQSVNKALEVFLDKALAAGTNQYGDKACEDYRHIRQNLVGYRRQYAGFIKDGRKQIFCGMVLMDNDEPPTTGQEYFEVECIEDGGTNILWFFYDVEKHKVTKMRWNGVA